MKGTLKGFRWVIKVEFGVSKASFSAPTKFFFRIAFGNPTRVFWSAKSVFGMCKNRFEALTVV